LFLQCFTADGSEEFGLQVRLPQLTSFQYLVELFPPPTPTLGQADVPKSRSFADD